MNVLIPWYVLVAVLMVGGLVLWWVNRKEEVLTLKRSVLEDANRQAFRNPGMLIAIIGGLVVTGITETSLLISALMPDASGNSNLAAFVRLVPIAVVVITVAWVLAKSWERTDPKWPALPGENDSSGNPGV